MSIETITQEGYEGSTSFPLADPDYPAMHSFHGGRLGLIKDKYAGGPHATNFKCTLSILGGNSIDSGHFSGLYWGHFLGQFSFGALLVTISIEG